MVKLPNDCRCSEPKVFPKNWQKVTASVKKDWYIFYRFYSPEYPKGRLCVIKGMNNYKTPSERASMARSILDNEIDMLVKHGYNPVTKACITPLDDTYEIEPDTPLMKALQKSFERIKCAKHTRECIKSCLNSVEKASKQISFNMIAVGQVRRRHIKQILDRCCTLQKLSAGSYNHYRAYLMMLFKELLEMDAIEMNPVAAISKHQVIKKVRETLSLEERKKVNDHLQARHYTFWRYLQIFFHSGARTTELFQLQGKDVNLNLQHFKLTIIKGTQRREVIKTIKDVALPYWQEIMKNCKHNQFVFSRNLSPGEASIRPDQIPKKWSKYVKSPKNKGGLNITADFYSLKHLHTDEVARVLSIDEASSHNGHTSTRTTLIYAIGEQARQAEKLRKVDNTFA